MPNTANPTDTTARPAPAVAERMNCMEVWGGNEPVERAVITAGLDIWLHSRPYRDQASGGDVHYVSSCASGRITRMLVADVSGHGTAVSRVAVSLRDLMRRHINYVDQRRFVAAVNRRIGKLTEDDHFATAVVATFFRTTRRLTVCNAGHPPPFVRRAADGPDAAWRIIGSMDDANDDPRADNIPLGVLHPVEYQETTTRLAPGDLVVFYSDGLLEARRPDGTMLGVAGLRALLPNDVGDDGDTVIPALLDRIRAETRGDLDHDDVTVMVLRANRVSTRWRDTLLAPLRMLRGAGSRSGADAR